MAGRLGLLAAAAALAVALLSARTASADGSAPSPDKKVTYSHEAMGTVVSVTIWTDDEKKAASSARAVFDEFDRIDALMSSWKPGSEVAAINDAAGKKAVKVSKEVFDVISTAQAMSRKSSGAFDITVGSYRGLWKFDQDRDGSIPSAAAIKARKRLVGWKNVRLSKGRKTVKLAKKGQRITLGGIAKGHAVDRAVALLHDADVLDFILQAGGDLYVSGTKSGKEWTVGIRDPRGGLSDSFAITAIKDQTFSTSGDYERSVVKDGTRYHHLLDPKTGRPAQGARSVTVMASDATTADTWSTALFVMGTKKGLALANRTQGIEAVFVDADNKVHVTKGFKLTSAAEFKKNGTGSLIGTIMVLHEPTEGI